MPGGKVSEWLAARGPGDEIEISSPFGWFRPARELRTLAPGIPASGMVQYFMLPLVSLRPRRDDRRGEPVAPAARRALCTHPSGGVF
jgi:hypothetical protein